MNPSDWIVKVGFWYVKHPTGEFTKNPNEAYGYRYKNSQTDRCAESDASEWREYVTFKRHVPPARISERVTIRRTGQASSVRVLRRDTAPDLSHPG